jgi:HAD superfamily hydrolase (TIGR01509 family)
MKQALLIDMDGTLVDSLPTLFEAYRSFLRRFGYSGSTEEFQALIGPSLEEIVALLKGRYNLSNGVSDLLDFYQLGLIAAYRSKIRALPFVRETLEYAKVQGMKLALVTSAPEHIAEACLEGVSLGVFFDAVVTKHDVLRCKPAPDLYLKALASLDIQAEAAWAIEDSPSGVVSAAAAGIDVLWLTQSQAQISVPEGRYRRVDDWNMILEILKRKVEYA